MSIQIITDSASDIANGEIEGVTVIPLTVTIDGTMYSDGVDLTRDEFYEKLENSDAMPVSSLVSPHQFFQAFEDVREAGDEAIVICISEGLSGTIQSAVIAADGFENVSIVDSRQVSGALRILVVRAKELVDQGLSREEIVRILEEEKSKIVIYAAVDTLKYLQKGGRVSKGSALLGGIIGVKPIVTLEDGNLVCIGKARGSKMAYKFLNQKLQEAGGIDFTKPYYAGYSGTDPSNMYRYIEDNRNLISDAPRPIETIQIGSAVGTHSGPGAVLVTFFKKG